jgi:hypothetical protein
MPVSFFDNNCIRKFNNYSLILPLASEANIPTKHRIVNKMKAIPIPLNNASLFSGVILDLPIKIDMISKATPILNICPVNLIVDNVDDATPKNFLSTELNTAFVFGDENNANPNPRKTRLVIINIKLVSAFKNINMNNPIVVIIIPAEATIRGSVLSEILPDIGENTAIITGCETNIIPAV